MPILAGLDALRERSALNALLDSNERFDPPKCDPDTRLAIIDHIMNWIKSEEQRASMLWLHGPAGAGKSALEQTIAELCRSQGVLLASFFFSRTIPNRSDGNSLIPTLAYQLMSAIPLIRSYVKVYIKQDPNIFHRTRDVQMRKLILEPLNSLRARINVYFKKKMASEGRFPRVVVIDGLDECADPKVQSDILQIIFYTIHNLKLPIRFLLASRPEPHITHIFEGRQQLPHISISRINLAFDQNANKDIHTFLVKEFQKIRRLHPELSSSWPLEDDIQALVRKASGQFIYASTVVDFLQSADHRPDDRLKVVLGLSPPHDNDAPFTQLDALYSYILSTGKNIQASLSVLALLILPSSRPQVVSLLGIYTTPYMLERLLRLRRGDVRLLLNNFLSLVTFNGSREPIQIHHASLPDFLCDKDRSGPYYIDIQEAEKNLARAFLRLIHEMKGKYTGLDPRFILNYLAPTVGLCRLTGVTDEAIQVLSDLDIVALYCGLINRSPWESVHARNALMVLLHTHHELAPLESSAYKSQLTEVELDKLWPNFTWQHEPFPAEDPTSVEDVFILVRGSLLEREKFTSDILSGTEHKSGFYNRAKKKDIRYKVPGKGRAMVFLSTFLDDRPDKVEQWLIHTYGRGARLAGVLLLLGREGFSVAHTPGDN
ncbi:hypothetical protein NLJ89_g3218 [Agrocybe chaxingu]|uniref:Nephrocystin 3-like N-terminal domain-containing protein n=1 Tax=Agrocybe chaxingu TaxID=84603 RepID=A0A9W8K5B5_9AGAR|nr:hypothetical protein NLJ89_g3218 [Agrocybe chaxingu]